jgi:hypothetical protein
MIVSECDPEKESDEESGDNGPFDGVSSLQEGGLALPSRRLSRFTYWRIPPPHSILLVRRHIRWDWSNELPLDDHLGVCRNAFASVTIW